MSGGDSHAGTRREFQDWSGHLRESTAHSLSYSRQYMLFDGRWQGQGGFHWGYAFYWRLATCFVFDLVPELNRGRVWSFFRRHPGGDAQSSQ